MSTLVWGVGTYTEGFYKARQDRYSMTREYDLWSGMLQRCYSEAELIKHPSYIGCTVDEAFLSFQSFASWCNSQIGFSSDGFHLDKDLLSYGDKRYAPDVCVFIPEEVNKFMIASDSSRGCYPVGVSWHKSSGKFQSRMSREGRSVYLGLHSTAKLAFHRYKTEKESYARELASKWRTSIDERAYTALNTWEVILVEGIEHQF